MQEFRTDAVVEPDAAGDFLHIGADLFAQISNLVDERDLGREERVRGVFYQLRRATAGEKHGRLVDVERPVRFSHYGACAIVFAADDDTVWSFEVPDRSALAQKFWVGCDADVQVRALLTHDALNFVAGPNRHRGFRDHNNVTGKFAGNLACGRENVAEVGMSIALPRRRADRDQNQLCVFNRVDCRRRKTQPIHGDIRTNKFIETGFKNRHDAGFQARYAIGVDVDAGDDVAEIRKASSGNEADVTRAKNRHAHRETSARLELRIIYSSLLLQRLR